MVSKMIVDFEVLAFSQLDIPSTYELGVSDMPVMVEVDTGEVFWA